MDIDSDNLKQRKKLFNAGSELFNQKPKKGIQFLQEQGEALFQSYGSLHGFPRHTVRIKFEIIT